MYGFSRETGRHSRRHNEDSPPLISVDATVPSLHARGMSAPSFSSFPDIFQPPSASTSQSQPGSSTEHHPRTFQNRDREKPRRSKEESYAPRHGSDRRRDRYDHEDDAYRRRRREEKAAKRQIKAEAEDLLQEVLGPRLLEEDRPRRPDLPSSAFWDTAGDRAAVTYGDSVSRSAPRYRRSGGEQLLVPTPAQLTHQMEPYSAFTQVCG